jgi:hypothetical protein
MTPVAIADDSVPSLPPPAASSGIISSLGNDEDGTIVVMYDFECIFVGTLSPEKCVRNLVSDGVQRLITAL